MGRQGASASEVASTLEALSWATRAMATQKKPNGASGPLNSSMKPRLYLVQGKIWNAIAWVADGKGTLEVAMKKKTQWRCCGGAIIIFNLWLIRAVQHHWRCGVVADFRRRCTGGGIGRHASIRR